MELFSQMGAQGWGLLVSIVGNLLLVTYGLHKSLQENKDKAQDKSLAQLKEDVAKSELIQKENLDVVKSDVIKIEQSISDQLDNISKMLVDLKLDMAKLFERQSQTNDRLINHDERIKDMNHIQESLSTQITELKGKVERLEQEMRDLKMAS